MENPELALACCDFPRLVTFPSLCLPDLQDTKNPQGTAVAYGNPIQGETHPTSLTDTQPWLAVVKSQMLPE